MPISYFIIRIGKVQYKQGVANMSTQRRVVSVTEASQILGIGRNLCYEAIRRREIPSIRCGKRILVPLEALNKLLSAESECGEQADWKEAE